MNKTRTMPLNRVVAVMTDLGYKTDLTQKSARLQKEQLE